MVPQLYGTGGDRVPYPADLPPEKYLIEVPPDSFIAVRRSDKADAMKRAAEVRALLAATMMLRSRLVSAFSDRPTALAWGLEYDTIHEDKKGGVHANKNVRLNEHVTLKARVCTKQMLRDSWREGKPLSADEGGRASWDIHSAHPACRLLGTHLVSSKWAGRLRALACHLNDASCASTYEHQLVMAITCLEGIFCTGGMHAKLLPRLEAFSVKSANESLTIKGLLDARNMYVHQGEALKEPNVVARFALSVSWVLWDHAAWFACAKPRQEDWEAYLDLRQHHWAAMKLVGEHYSKDSTITMAKQVNDLFEQHIPGSPTVRGKAPT